MKTYTSEEIKNRLLNIGEPYYSIASYSWEMAENHGYYLEKFFGNLTEDKKPRYFVNDDKPIGRPYHDDD